MRLLLDSNILYWAVLDSKRISASTASLLADPANEAWVSSVSMAEFRIKQRIGKLSVPDIFEQEVLDLGYQRLLLKFEHTRWLATLPLHHRDPFDRMLIAQAIEESLTLLTSDGKFDLYPVAVIKN
jgi:PIN domain nuclease of toxin-antitoxin system